MKNFNLCCLQTETFYPFELPLEIFHTIKNRDNYFYLYADTDGNLFDFIFYF